MQALIRPWPGATWLQNRAISGLHARSTARAAGFCAMTLDADSNKTVAITKSFPFGMMYPGLPSLRNGPT